MANFDDLSNGTTALATVSDTNVQAFSGDTRKFNKIVINNGSVAGYWSKGGASGVMHYIGANQAISLSGQNIQADQVYIQRIAGGSNMSTNISLFTERA